MSEQKLYDRLGGYDAIVGVAEALFVRVRACPELGRFWAHRGDDGIDREKQLLIDYLCASSGGPMYYTGRDMRTAHRGMRISDSDWSTFAAHVSATLAAAHLPETERNDVIAFIESSKADVVEA